MWAGFTGFGWEFDGGVGTRAMGLAGCVWARPIEVGDGWFSPLAFGKGPSFEAGYVWFGEGVRVSNGYLGLCVPLGAVGIGAVSSFLYAGDMPVVSEDGEVLGRFSLLAVSAKVGTGAKVGPLLVGASLGVLGVSDAEGVRFDVSGGDFCVGLEASGRGFGFGAALGEREGKFVVGAYGGAGPLCVSGEAEVGREILLRGGVEFFLLDNLEVFAGFCGGREAGFYGVGADVFLGRVGVVVSYSFSVFGEGGFGAFRASVVVR